MTAETQVAVSRRLPAQFKELEAVLEWALPTEEERYAKRIGSSQEELQAFYDVVMPRAAEARDYLDQFELDAMPDDAQRLMWLLFSLIVVSYSIEVFGRPTVPDTAAAYIKRVGEPPTYPV